jgi:hypothetical protein
MNSAYLSLGKVLVDAELQLPGFPIVSNVTGAPAETLPEFAALCRSGDQHGALERLHGMDARTRLRSVH